MPTQIHNGTTYTIPSGIDKAELNGMEMQRGPTCGIYALQTILRAYGYNVFATKGGDAAIKSLRHIAKHKTPSTADANRPSSEKIGSYGFTKIGELFYASEIPQLLECIKSELKALNITKTATVETINSDLFSKIKTAIDSGKLVMVPFSVDTTTGLPESTSGNAAHWCVVWGYDDITKKLLAAHWGQVFEFDASVLQGSNERIKSFQASTWGKPKGKPMDKYEITKSTETYEKTVTFVEIPLGQTLAKKIVVI